MLNASVVQRENASESLGMPTPSVQHGGHSVHGVPHIVHRHLQLTFSGRYPKPSAGSSSHPRGYSKRPGAGGGEWDSRTAAIIVPPTGDRGSGWDEALRWAGGSLISGRAAGGGAGGVGPLPPQPRAPRGEERSGAGTSDLTCNVCFLVLFLDHVFQVSMLPPTPPPCLLLGFRTNYLVMLESRTGPWTWEGELGALLGSTISAGL